MKRIKLEVEIYNRKIVIYSMREDESEDMVKYLINNEKEIYPYCTEESKRKLEEDIKNFNSGGRTIKPGFDKTILSDNRGYFILINEDKKKSDVILIHELHHVQRSICKLLRIDDAEAEAYLFDYIWSKSKYILPEYGKSEDYVIK